MRSHVLAANVFPVPTFAVTPWVQVPFYSNLYENRFWRPLFFSFVGSDICNLQSLHNVLAYGYSTVSLAIPSGDFLGINKAVMSPLAQLLYKNFLSQPQGRAKPSRHQFSLSLERDQSYFGSKCLRPGPSEKGRSLFY